MPFFHNLSLGHFLHKHKPVIRIDPREMNGTLGKPVGNPGVTTMPIHFEPPHHIPLNPDGTPKTAVFNPGVTTMPLPTFKWGQSIPCSHCNGTGKITLRKGYH